MVNEKTILGLKFTPWAKYGFWPVQVSDISTLKFAGEKIKCCTKNFELLWGAFYSTFNAEYWEKYQEIKNMKTYQLLSPLGSFLSNFKSGILGETRLPTLWQTFWILRWIINVFKIKVYFQMKWTNIFPDVDSDWWPMMALGSMSRDGSVRFFTFIYLSIYFFNRMIYLSIYFPIEWINWGLKKIYNQYRT